MIDKTGMIIAHPKEEHVLTLDLKTLKGMESIASAMMAGKAGVEPYVFDKVDKIGGYAPIALTG